MLLSTSAGLRDLGAALLAVLAAVLPARAGWRSCPEAGPAGREVLACCTAPAEAEPSPCCCEEPEPETAPQAPVENGGAHIAARDCDCTAAPAPPERPARPAEAALEAGRELRARFAAQVQALAPELPAVARASAPCAGREPPGRGSPLAALEGPARLHLLSVARL